MQSPTTLIIVALFIILPLAGYAIYLSLKVRKHHKEHQQQIEEETRLARENTEKRNNELISDIRFIAKSMQQEQCEITEGVLRIHVLADALDTDIMLQQPFETIHAHYLSVKEFPILDAYKALSRKEQFKLDSQRMKLEAANQEKILAEIEAIINHSFDSLRPLQ